MYKVKTIQAHLKSLMFVGLIFCALPVLADKVSEAADAAYLKLDNLQQQAQNNSKILDEIGKVRANIEGIVNAYENNKTKMPSMMPRFEESALKSIKSSMDYTVPTIEKLISNLK